MTSKPLLEAKPRTNDDAALAFIYKLYVVYECVLINLVGFGTLVLQCPLQTLESKFLETHPSVPQKLADLAFGHFWLQGEENCATREAQCLTLMIAGWLFIAGVLQIFVNFDGLRQKIFKDDWESPRGLKIVCMYSFFICDWYWVVLMYFYRDVIGWQQIAGSAFDIALRVAFALKPARMFKNN